VDAGKAVEEMRNPLLGRVVNVLVGAAMPIPGVRISEITGTSNTRSPPGASEFKQVVTATRKFST
jgi:hypothetical protein